jgi:hypothetical protein
MALRSLSPQARSPSPRENGFFVAEYLARGQQSLFALKRIGPPSNQRDPDILRQVQNFIENALLRNNLGALARPEREAVAILRKLASEPGALPRYRENLSYALSRGSGARSDKPL